MKRWLTLLALVTGVAAGQDTPQPPPAQEQPEIVNQTPPAGTPPAVPAADPAAPPAADPAAAPAPAAADTSKAIPQAYSEEHYAATWSRNPFLIETAVKEHTIGPGFAEDWELKGLTRDKGQPEALLSNKKTQEIRWVKTTEDKDGFKLLKANIDRDMHKSSVEVAKAGEPSPATFTFPEVAAAPAPGGGVAPRPQPGMPQQVPGGGRVGVPGQTGANVQRSANGVMPQNQNMGGGNVPRMNPGIQNGGNAPRMNPGVKPNGIMSIPGNPPNPPGRRRVLIPSSPPAS